MTAQSGWEIFNRKGNTCYGIAASATSIVKSILFNENQIYPVSVNVDGAYGLSGVFLSVPTIIDKTGAKEVVEINLQPDEEAALQKSAGVLKSFYQELEM